MPDLSTTGANAALNGIGAIALWVSLHTTDPGTTGANEVSGGSYTRQAITWNTSSSNSLFNTAIISFTNMPFIAGNVWLGLWTAVTSGNFVWGAPTAAVTGPIPGGGAVSFTVASIGGSAS